MQELIQQYRTALDKFKHIQFTPETHTYLIDGALAESVTSVLKKYLKPFERDYWANIKANQAGVSIEDILSKWEYNAKFAQIKGTLVHEFIEYRLTNRDFVYPEELILKEFGFDPIQTPFNQIVEVVEKFLVDIENKMYPVASELIIGDTEYLIGGTIDQLFYNKKSASLEIWDWKTNKEIKLESRYFHLAPLQHVPDTELHHYSLQLALYKRILESNTGLTLGNSYIVWFNENSPKYHIYKTHDYADEAEVILDEMLKQSGANL
jgi:ATP-dependent exoDNAse (exonuclease V) beta subunit